MNMAISAPPSFDWPYIRSTNTIGTSPTLYPACLALTTISIWNAYPCSHSMGDSPRVAIIDTLTFPQSSTYLGMALTHQGLENILAIQAECTCQIRHLRLKLQLSWLGVLE